MDKHVFLLCIILLISSASVGIDLITDSSKEGFLSPGNYPVSAEKPLLRGFYKEKKNPQVIQQTSGDIYKDYPVFPASCTYNNNIRYWDQPTNGQCSPAVFCNALYEKTKHPIPKPPRAPLWDSGKRVNYYDTTKN